MAKVSITLNCDKISIDAIGYDVRCELEEVDIDEIIKECGEEIIENMDVDEILQSKDEDYFLRQGGMMIKLSKYQKEIEKDLRSGALLRCSEGENYKCWLFYPETKKHKSVRRDSANTVCTLLESELVFGENDGIRIRNLSKK